MMPHYGPDGLMDLDHAATFIRQNIAANDGDLLVDEQRKLARLLAIHLSKRDGRDGVETGRALIEAASCLTGLASDAQILNASTVLLLNILGMAGVNLTEPERPL